MPDCLQGVIELHTRPNSVQKDTKGHFEPSSQSSDPFYYLYEFPRCREITSELKTFITPTVLLWFYLPVLYSSLLVMCVHRLDLGDQPAGCQLSPGLRLSALAQGFSALGGCDSVAGLVCGEAFCGVVPEF